MHPHPPGDFPTSCPPCPDCQAPTGQLHSPGCFLARCAGCGCQAVSCGCPPHTPTCRWSGLYPGVTDAAALGWYTRWDQDAGRWRACAPTDPGARPDLSRLHGGEAVWNRERQRWQAKPPPAPLGWPAHLRTPPGPPSAP